jgi:hypothetical protein
MSRYPVGTQVENKNGYVKVKISAGKWEGLGAHLLKEAGVNIVEGDRVFFADGNRLNRSVENLRRIHFNSTKFVLLARSRPIFIPKLEPIKPAEVSLTRKKLERVA